MAEYTLKVTTGDMKYAGTMDHLYVILCGTEGKSERTKLDNLMIHFQSGKTRTYSVKTKSSLGKLLIVKVEKDPRFGLPEDEWFCSRIVVTTQNGEEVVFPCYRWISRGEKVELRGGKAMKVFEDVHPLQIEHREDELRLRKSLYQWEMGDGKLLQLSQFRAISELPAEIRFSASKSEEMSFKKRIIGYELMFKRLVGSKKQWKNLKDMKKFFQTKKTTMSEYVSKHWDEDDFFGFQYLNGPNPNVIKLCKKLPSNFPVEEMVRDFLPRGSTLEMEMEKGNIFLVDQKIMDGIPTRMDDGRACFISSGFCLFYMNPDKKLVPLAIQLRQQHSEQNPIFLPDDPLTDWVLAKLFFNSSDLVLYQAVYHLMKTHYLAEVFTVATLRCFPSIHPLYKLLFPHFRYTLHINILAREFLLGPGGAMSQSSCGVDGLMELMRRAQSDMTYSSLCLPENIKARGLNSVPDFYYRDDGLKLWSHINSYVKSMVEYFYPSDSVVCDDTELQEWIHEIFTHGFLENKLAGFPASFGTVAEVIKFITMVIFIVSVQHAAVNNGQFDYHGWTPNGSLLLHTSPPTIKGLSSMGTFLEALPNEGETVNFAASAFVLSSKYTDKVPLGEYPEELFDESDPKRMIKEFQAELSYLKEEIKARNTRLKVPYTYLSPDEIENSVSI
ncbi:hydroperoxide isomerase ALOXE3 [Nothobranchius furzeri]|uniref:hydroperoxide isomerase ALOXE3 n=1 Tax=Nothobranchius furzeri TaxID=105023 RepID=UPI0024040C09|nr:hydroperoxide isomerase ALOXE3 [Nothobranchius furzeri]